MNAYLFYLVILFFCWDVSAQVPSIVYLKSTNQVLELESINHSELHPNLEMGCKHITINLQDGESVCTHGDVQTLDRDSETSKQEERPKRFSGSLFLGGLSSNQISSPLSAFWNVVIEFPLVMEWVEAEVALDNHASGDDFFSRMVQPSRTDYHLQIKINPMRVWKIKNVNLKYLHTSGHRVEAIVPNNTGSYSNFYTSGDWDSFEGSKFFPFPMFSNQNELKNDLQGAELSLGYLQSGSSVNILRILDLNGIILTRYASSGFYFKAQINQTLNTELTGDVDIEGGFLYNRDLNPVERNDPNIGSVILKGDYLLGGASVSKSFSMGATELRMSISGFYDALSGCQNCPKDTSFTYPIFRGGQIHEVPLNEMFPRGGINFGIRISPK